MSTVLLQLPRRSTRRLDLPLRSALALWWLAMKRSGEVLLVPAVAAVMGWLVWDGQLEGLVFWVTSVQRIAYSVAIAGPLVAAFACWAAGQSRRRGMTDMLSCAALPSAWSTVAATAGTIAWGLIAFLGSAAAILLWTATRATWGRPDPWPLVIATGAVVVCGLVGVLAGRLSSSRMLPPLLALGAVGFLVGPMGVGLNPLEMLSPLAAINRITRDWMYLADHAVVWPHLRWQLALGGTLALALLLWPVRSMLARGVVAAAVAATVAAAIPLSAWPEPTLTDWENRRLAPYEPSCVVGAVTVCVHPAYDAVLDEAAPIIDAFVAPIAGLDGVPTRFDQNIGQPPAESGQALFTFWDASTLHAQIPHTLATELLVWTPGMASEPEGDAQYVVAEWLMLHVPGQPTDDRRYTMADLHPDGMPMTNCTASGCEIDHAQQQAFRQTFDAAVARFAALDPAARRAWLEANWTDLRAGRLSMEDLP